MKEKKFKVFATDSTNIWELFFITQSTSGDFYLGQISPVGYGKYSRHVSGKLHYKSGMDNEYQNIREGQKLTEFKGMEQLLCYCISKDAFKKHPPGKPYGGKKFDGSAFIDIRNYDELIGISPMLLEPKQTQLLANQAKIFSNPQIIIFTQTTPWLVLLVYEPKKSK